MFSCEVPSIGPALEGTEVRVVDASGAAVGEGARGELVVRGHSTMLGYFEDRRRHGARHRRGRLAAHRRRGLLPHARAGGPSSSSPAASRRSSSATPRSTARCGSSAGSSTRCPSCRASSWCSASRTRRTARRSAPTSRPRRWTTRSGRGCPRPSGPCPSPSGPRSSCTARQPIPRTHTGKIQRRKMQPWFAPWATHRGAMVVAAPASVREHHPVADAVLANALQGCVHVGHRRRLDLGADAVLGREREHLADRRGAADVAAADRRAGP